MSDSSRTNGATGARFVTDRFAGNPLKSHSLPPVESRIFFLSYFFFPFFPPPRRPRCIMIVQMRAARGLPGSLRNPSPSSFVVNPCAPASAQRDRSIRRIMIFGCRDHRAVRRPPPRPAETDPIVRACRFFCTQ